MAWNIEAVGCATIVKEKETIVKNRIAQIKLECTCADFCQEFVGLNKLENEVSGDEGDYRRNPFSNFFRRNICMFPPFK